MMSVVPTIISLNKYTPMERQVLSFIKDNQPCTLRSIVDSGMRQKTVSNILSRIKFIKRAHTKSTCDEPNRFVYWLDSECAPQSKTNLSPADKEMENARRNSITQDPLIVALFQMKVDHCRLRF